MSNNLAFLPSPAFVRSNMSSAALERNCQLLNLVHNFVMVRNPFLSSRNVGEVLPFSGAVAK